MQSTNFTAGYTLYQERSQKGDSGCASEKLGVPHLKKKKKHAYWVLIC